VCEPWPRGSTTSGGDTGHILSENTGKVRKEWWESFESCYVQQIDSSVKKLHTLYSYRKCEKLIWQQPGKSNSTSSVARLPCWIIKNAKVWESSDLSSADIFILRAQQAIPFWCRFANNRHFSLIALSQCRNCGDAIDAKTYVGLLWSAATRTIAWHVDEITLVEQMSIRVALSWSFLWACSTGLPQSREGSSSYIPARKFVLFLLKQQPRHWTQMVPNKHFGFLLLCVKLHMMFERTRVLKDGKIWFEIEWIVTSAETCSRRNLKMRPDQKITAAIYDSKHAWFFLTYINDLYSCSFKKYYTPIWFGS